MLLAATGLYPQYTAIMTVLRVLGVIQVDKPKVTNVQGDASIYHEKNKMQLYVLVPVVESLLQFLVQSVIIYNMVGPHLVKTEPLKNAFIPVDVSSLCFDTSISSKAIYAVQLLSSFASLCISFTL